MSEWGPGAPDDKSLSAVESEQEPEEEDEGQSPEPEEETSQEPAQSEESDTDEVADQRGKSERVKWHFGTSEDVLAQGEYEFLPVFGFNEGHVAVRRYVERKNLDEDEWWEEDGTEGKMFDDENAAEEPTKIAGRELSWWEDESIMPKHPFMLINPVGFTTADADEHDFRDLFRMQKGEQFVFSDSGGYQIMSMDDARIVDSRDDHSFQDLDVYPERLLEWQVSNADAGATIDYPPYNISSNANFPDAVEHTPDWKQFYEKRKDQSAEMAARMGERLVEMREDDDREAKDYLFTPVIHGKPHPHDTQKYVREWHQSMLAPLDFEPRGWVLKPEPSHNFGQIAMHLGYAAEELTDAEYLHVLMVGGLLQKTLLMYFAHRTDAMVTSDASSYAAGGKRRQFDLPKTARRRSVIITNRSDEEREDAMMDAHRLDRYPCRCQVCDTVERTYGFGFVTEGTGSARNATLNLHNLHQALSVERTLDALLREEDTEIVETGGEPTGSEFWRYVTTIATEKKVEDLYRAMDYVRLAQEKGLDEANRLYRIRWAGSSGRTIVSASQSAAADSW